MSHTKTTALNYGAIIRKAKTGHYQLPAFQRKWTWTTRQVMSLYESLRLGYPIGAFLFLTSPEGRMLGPREFHGAGKLAAGNESSESLVLDGQQRITAGLSILFGLEGVGGNEYYINCAKLDALLTEQSVNLDDDAGVAKFAESIDLDSGYLVAKPHRLDRNHFFAKSGLVWTGYLTQEKQSYLDELLDASDKRIKSIVRKLVRVHLSPNENIQVPVIELGAEFDMAGISKIFSTINSSGKTLTPFELVVAILYPSGIKLEDDVDSLKQQFRYYSNMDKNGEILLQVIALLSGKSPKKSDLPKTIDPASYQRHRDVAAAALNEVGKFLTQHVGLGLDVTGKLTPYDALYAPMAVVYHRVMLRKLSNAELGEAQRKLRRWFVASAVSQRYQEGVHSKQERDANEMEAWILGDAEPKWVSAVVVTPSFKLASPTGALGKLLLCLINSSAPSDPVLGGSVGYRDGVSLAQVHHIFPTRWSPKGISDYKKSAMDTNIALNTMILAAETNADWLNFDPRNQVEQSKFPRERSFHLQMISDEAIGVLLEPSKRVSDYDRFIELRYRSLVQRLAEFGVQESDQPLETIELDDPSIIEE
ncbi:DUF262 domain-containing protein [Stenotrophomonas sp. DDT-1]|uniref:GmrSD restriction endonuclease domain-containing protein n=1 Tax=Stenotrophomonas sp. DDT-1 TaxID=1609637 RepID=UPI0007774683|nr:DUF262 domain-containing protein [Stenotrophomonas sp. DDT-1]